MIESEFATLTERHRHELHVHCYRMLGNFQEAEDHVQETFLRAWRSRRSFQGRLFRAWLYKIATNTCLDTLNRSQRRGRRDVCRGPVAAADPRRAARPGGAERGAAGRRRRRPRDDRADLHRLIQSLPARQRAALILRDVLGWSAAETAGVLETSVAAANSALQRARATIGDALPEPRPAELTGEERRLLEGFIDSHEREDTDAAVALMREDIRVTMPPHPWLYEGRDQVLPLLARAFADDGHGDWRLLPTRANRMPAAASYLRAPGDGEFRAFKLDVIRERGGLIAEVTTFSADLFGAFGLPPTL